MFQMIKKQIEWGGRPLTLETGRIARQADGAVVVSYGETSLLCTVVAAKKPMPGIDFFPLTVHYQEKAFAAGKIPGGFFKREGKPSEKEVLTSRLVDRPVRPLFHPEFKNETQILCTLLSHDLENDPDGIAIIGAAAALAISGIPFQGPLAGARVGYIENQYVLNPTNEQMKSSALDLMVAGTRDGVMMVESEAHVLPEEVMLGAVMFGHEQIQPVLEMIQDLAEEAGKPAWVLEDRSKEKEKLFEKIRKKVEKELTAAYKEKEKQVRSQKIAELKAQILEEFVEEEGLTELQITTEFKNLEKKIVRGSIFKTKKRIDGRKLDEIRPILGEVGILPRAHGSALFTRGETQALVACTLGTAQDEQLIDALEGEYRQRFMLHYNFPPFSTGEVGRVSSPGRREIGHGKLAWRALNPLMPKKEEFPYTVRVVSEITESNGSSSMATVCGGSLSMMDAGVPLKSAVAGIAMGLVKEEKDFIVLSDILGDEDHLGDMDFKVAGTHEGITALQMDIKVVGITAEIMKVALEQAHQGRLHILKEMNKALKDSRENVHEYAPRMTTIKINPEKIRDVIGPGGKVIREICETTGVKIDISDEGVVEISAPTQTSIEAALERIHTLTAQPEVGTIYKGIVKKITDFGAFVDFLGGQSGLVHISQLAPQRVNKTSDIVAMGDQVYVKLVGYDDRGKAKLSMKVVDQETGQEIALKTE